ncbi:lipopolysaccharide heptosyltransferase I [Pseudazoarcus pumilus]|uniref:Lipopolysaccharide heptosyltransferase 1 n=1 Tax=Pseudazoarcus pumilus TaxID=2067960 RepID=A0A2I6S8X6_9RHOO|nr:lipopolysaccharide heptosyltransferase I [Pseudazoarcus pumilus]AUN95681.1 lipopolysaccharide heptosyltransferase I [Pseudazoarcus pumilus]
MKVLVVKTSSLGDVIHTLPALTDAARAIPGVRFDWLVEENFAEVPAWHPAVERVIPVALRRWRRSVLRTWLAGEWQAMTRSVKLADYDLVIDAQGLIKSAILTRYAGAPVHGLDRASIREPLASRFYDQRHAVAKGRHAVERVRELFAKALGYDKPDTPCDYGLERTRVFGDAPPPATPTLLFLHGTTWATKHWPEMYWRDLTERCTRAGWQLRLPWGNDAERERAERIAANLSGVTVLPRLTLAGIAGELAGAAACVAVDTGLGHLAAALDVPTVSLFGPTRPELTGAWGPRQRHLASDFPCAPCLSARCRHYPTKDELARFDVVREKPLCYTRLEPDRVFAELSALVNESGRPAPETAR